MNMNRDCLRPPTEQEGTVSPEDTHSLQRSRTPSKAPTSAVCTELKRYLRTDPQITFLMRVISQPRVWLGSWSTLIHPFFQRHFSMKSMKSVTVKRLALYRIIALSNWRWFVSLWVCFWVFFFVFVFLTWVECVASDDVLGISRNCLLVALAKRVEWIHIWWAAGKTPCRRVLWEKERPFQVTGGHLYRFPWNWRTNKVLWNQSKLIITISLLSKWVRYLTIK